MRRRMIDPSLWDDPDINALPPLAMILFIGLFSNADDFGNIKADPRYLRKKLFGYRDVTIEQVCQWRDACVQLRSVALYQVNHAEYIHLANWTTYQKLDSRYTLKASCPPFPDGSPTNTLEDTAPVDDSEKRGTVTPHSLEIERDAGKSKAKLSKEKLSKAKLLQQPPDPPPRDSDFGQALTEYENSFGPLGSPHLYDRFQGLWDDYPVPEMHEYARSEMREAMLDPKRRVKPNLTYYTRCLGTVAARDYVVVEEDE